MVKSMAIYYAGSSDSSKFSGMAYEKYKLDWLMKNNYTLDNLLEVLDKIFLEYYDAHQFDCSVNKYDLKPSCFMDDFEDGKYNFGFDGKLYKNYDNFYESEYMDAEYMKTILNKDEYTQYLEYTKEEREEYAKENADIEK